MTFAVIFNCAIWCNILVIGLKPNTPIKGIRYFLIRVLFWFTARFVIWGAVGGIWISYYRPEVCYKKYLGPDWVADYDGTRCSTVISNHSAFLDSMIHGLCQFPSIIAKGEVRDVPGVGPIARVSQCFFLDRTSRDDKKKMQEQIIERQRLSDEDPDWEPLIIHAEGGTSNGSKLIKFKRGAFMALRSIWPKVHKFHSYF